YPHLRRFVMRFPIKSALVLVFTAFALPAYAANLDNKIPDQQSIEALEMRASQAPAREQCFLYAELVHDMIELSVRQYAAGDATQATGFLKKAQQITQKIHLALSDNDKRLKNAQILLRHTAFRLTELLHTSASEDRSLVQQTLAEVNQAQNEAMLQVFRK